MCKTAPGKTLTALTQAIVLSIEISSAVFINILKEFKIILSKDNYRLPEHYAEIYFRSICQLATYF